MGKTGGSSSWLTAVKNVFRSPEKKCTRRRDRQQDEDEQQQQTKRAKRRWLVQKRAKRRWLFKKASSATTTGVGDVDTVTAEETEKTATRAAKEAVFFCRKSVYLKRHLAAILIQTAFRGCLARKALRALKGVVKLQALVRGQNVRRRATNTLVRVQALVRAQSHHRKTLTTSPVAVHDLSLSRAFSKQMWRSRAREAHSESELEDKRINRFGYQETSKRMSTDQSIFEPVKIVEIDTYNAYSHHQQLNERTPRGNSCFTRQVVHSTPNYMSTTASSLARLRRPQSVPRQRSNRTGLDNEPIIKLVRKRLSFHNDNPQSHDFSWYDKKRTDAREDY